MSRQLPPLRSIRLLPKSDYDRFTGNRGEIYYDPVNDTLRVFDSETVGGSILATRDWVLANSSDFTVDSIRSNSDINIDVNLTDSTLRRWRFGEDGDLRLPGALITNGYVKALGTTDGNGDNLTVQAGETITGNGGDITVHAGDTVTGIGGDLTVRSGYTTSGDGGILNIRAGDAVTGDAGDIDIRAGDTITGDGGSITITAGSTVNDGPGGSVTITSGSNTSGAAGDISLVAATSVAGADGVINLTTAVGSWTFGDTGNLTFPDETVQTTAWTGTITSLSNLEDLSFSRGVAVAEFSSDATFTDNANDTVPTEQAIRTYIDRRLGLTHNGDVVNPVNKIGPTYLNNEQASVIIESSTSSTSDSDQTFDSSQHTMAAWVASFSQTRTLNISNLTSGRRFTIYIRNTNGSTRTINIRASTTNSGHSAVNVAVGAGQTSRTDFTLAATTGTTVITVFNANGVIGGSAA